MLARFLQGNEGDVFKVAALDKSGKWREFAAKVEKVLPDGTYRDNLKGEVKPPKSICYPPAIRRPQSSHLFAPIPLNSINERLNDLQQVRERTPLPPPCISQEIDRQLQTPLQRLLTIL